MNPGNYELKENMMLKDLILEAGGINNDIIDIDGDYFIYRVEIAREDYNKKNSIIFYKQFHN